MSGSANSPVDGASDIRRGDWIDRYVPPPARPYLRLARVDRPIGTWLLLLPCWWSVALATPGWPDPWLLVLFAVGALVMRGAGCTLNDIADRHIDGRVARTATRPIPSGQVTVFQAVVWMGTLCLIGLAVLVQFNPFAIWLGIASLLVVAVYPFIKRISDWPQAVLGLAFNWGALLGWAAVRGDLGLPPILLYGAGILWTLSYDTIYAHQDREDDALVGVRSTALRLGRATPRWLFGFSGVCIALIGTAGVLAGLAWPFFLILAVAAGHLFWQAATVDIDDPKDCLTKFRSNRDFGFIVLAAILLGQIFG